MEPRTSTAIPAAAAFTPLSFLFLFNSSGLHVAIKGLEIPFFCTFFPLGFLLKMLEAREESKKKRINKPDLKFYAGNRRNE